LGYFSGVKLFKKFGINCLVLILFGNTTQLKYRKIMNDQVVTSSSRVITPLPASIKLIIEKLEEKKDLKPSEMRRIVLDAKVKPEDLEPWADFDHPIADSYGRKLIYKGDNYEIMAMSWRPGDFSTIHDHGYTQWGCVQVFGPAEHATFRIEDDTLRTLARWRMEPNEAIGVNHDLVHQMGNPTKDTFFLTLHVYGELEAIESVTGDARVFDLENETIQRVDGGVFFALPDAEVQRLEKGPRADFPTRLRHIVELIRRLNKMESRGANKSSKTLDKVLDDFFHIDHREAFLQFLNKITDEQGYAVNSVAWRLLNWELKVAAELQCELLNESASDDNYHKYAELYDVLIGEPRLHRFMADYIRFFEKQTEIDFSTISMISLGCGTGLVESFFQSEMGVKAENLFGFDISESMVNVANRRIDAEVGDVLTLDPGIRLWDMAYSGLQVFHYIAHEKLEEAIQKTANVVKPGGYFLGDFITPDFIRKYPNVLRSEDGQVISLRSPELIEKNGMVFQRNEVVNMDFREGQMRISNGGVHQLILPPMNRVRSYFEKAFGGSVELFDALTLEPIAEWADSCESARYIVMAKKG
jgi:SAM-dependent methyltransferase/predicted metal-dependent enzyme (double-stranded beta helix superfamily)